LEAVDEDELREIYESYRAFDGYWTEEGQLRRFCPTTPYESLTPQVRQVLRHPWLLRMVMEAYDGKPVPERLWTGDILNAFCEAKIFGRTDEERERFAPRSQLVTELVRLMRKLKRDNFLRDELHDFSAEWSKALLERELTRSPYLQLLDEGVLMETPIAEEWGRFRRIVGYQVRFAFEPLFEFLLSNELLAEGGGWKGLTGKKVARWLSEGGDFDHLTGAVMILLTEAVQEGNLSLVAETLNAADIKLAEPVIIEVLTTLEGLKDERFEPLLDELAEKAESEKALTVLINASYQFGIKQRHRPALACTERAERLAKHLVEVEGGVELANDLARALVNKGIALSDLGHHKEAIDCYDEAIEIRRRLVEVEGRVELENDLASALMNKGNALSYLGHPKEAIDCYEEAIGIYRRLVEVEGRVELENDLAGALMNKGVALSDLGRLSEALQCYDEGIGLWEMMMAEGKIHVAPLLIKGLGNRFELKQQMGDWEGAADDVRKVLACVMPFLSSDSLTEALAMEFGSFLWRLRQLTEEEWTALASALGEYAELVRQLMQL
jgi:tetratricopeptide (TPR) repeat protein